MTLRQLDERFVHHYGYSSVAEYHAHISPATTAHHVYVPTLAVSAQDDPVCAIAGLPPREPPGSRGPGLFVVQTGCGGHLAYPSGEFPYSHAWPDDIVVDWINLFTSEL
jgi:predicted alpha/beta-fold hydrolase